MNGKKLAGEKAADFVEDGMTVGLGTGSTVYFTIKKIGERIQNGLCITGIPTSEATKELAAACHIPMVALNDADHIDLTIDGADEIDPGLNGIKGGGGALLFEKLVAKASGRNIWVADESKLVKKLGAFPLPVEVIPFGYKMVMKELERKGLQSTLRLKDGRPYETDSKHYILDIKAGNAGDIQALGAWLDSISGIVEHGLFLGIADMAVIGHEQHVSILKKEPLC
ncbi:ribose-5-phosphate isomerase RpiA [Heyndrickxia acidiproducens]|uniref:ribose-5-phosphate isomerase RpiA n=1 Tax=Heyndrickxia acidiproducens TaxID=1121084 RepID=UPI00036F7B1B|nr:ribose-5-phosphate isomerase RpiA [Heyndrickxia acidiproducens]